MPSLTPKQKKILDFIVAFTKKVGYSPSLAEIAHHFKKSITTIHQHVETLKNKGELVKQENVWRGIQPQQPVTQIFLLGYIAAGQPIEPFENPEPIQVPLNFTPTPGNYYALKVKGQSMVDDGIRDGDTIIVRHQKTAINGDRVIAVTEKGATLKVYREQDGKIYLEPRNKKFKIIYPEKLEIRGKFAGVVKASVTRNKQEVLGQYFTKPEIVRQLLSLLFGYKPSGKKIKILEPSFGTGNFINELKREKFFNIDGCEIDQDLTKNPCDFFELPLTKKFDLLIGNPPFSKYNLKESYWRLKNYISSTVWPSLYLTKKELKKDKEKIENIFILKSLKHIKNKNSAIGYVLPISFFIKNKNKPVKDEILKYFTTVIIYQNDKVWFERNIPCCFAIFTNVRKFKNQIVVIYENSRKNEQIFDLKNIHEELIPQIIFHKNNGFIKNNQGVPLIEFLEKKKVKVRKSYKENNVSAGNILGKNKIPADDPIDDYKLAVVRVGNASVGKCGLINVNHDVLNDMFYVFDFKDRFKKNKRIKEAISRKINKQLDYFRNITCRVGSKSIKKEDILNFKVII